MTVTRLALATLAALTLPGAAQAQRVVADIRVEEGPVAGHIIVGDQRSYPNRRIIEADPRYNHPPAYHTVTVFRVRRGDGWYRHHGFREVRVWYDADRDRFFDRYDGDHRGLRAVEVFERGGRYYRDYDWRNGDRHGRDHDDRYDHNDRD